MYSISDLSAVSLYTKDFYNVVNTLTSIESIVAPMMLIKMISVHKKSPNYI